MLQHFHFKYCLKKCKHNRLILFLRATPITCSQKYSKRLNWGHRVSKVQGKALSIISLLSKLQDGRIFCLRGLSLIRAENKVLRGSNFNTLSMKTHAKTFYAIVPLWKFAHQQEPILVLIILPSVVICNLVLLTWWRVNFIISRVSIFVINMSNIATTTVSSQIEDRFFSELFFGVVFFTICRSTSEPDSDLFTLIGCASGIPRATSDCFLALSRGVPERGTPDDPRFVTGMNKW